VKLGAKALPAAHVQAVGNLLYRQGRFLSQSRRKRQFARTDFGSLTQPVLLPTQFAQRGGDDRLRARLVCLPPDVARIAAGQAARDLQAFARGKVVAA